MHYCGLIKKTIASNIIMLKLQIPQKLYAKYLKIIKKYFFSHIINKYL
jgi:hypothetical protein